MAVHRTHTFAARPAGALDTFVIRVTGFSNFRDIFFDTFHQSHQPTAVVGFALGVRGAGLPTVLFGLATSRI